MGRLVDLEGASVALAGTHVLRGIDLTLDEGEVLGVSGPNGAGKTTLLRLLATLIPPTAGHGTILGSGLGSDSIWAIRSRIGLISHRPAVLPELDLAENLHHAVALAGLEHSKVDVALRVVGLDAVATTRARFASFGMLRRTEVARLLITSPQLLLLDEPFSGLDVEAQDLIGAMVERTVERGGGVAMVSHDATQLLTHVGRVHALASGRLEQTS